MTSSVEPVVLVVIAGPHASGKTVFAAALGTAMRRSGESVVEVVRRAIDAARGSR